MMWTVIFLNMSDGRRFLLPWTWQSYVMAMHLESAYTVYYVNYPDPHKRGHVEGLEYVYFYPFQRSPLTKGRKTDRFVIKSLFYFLLFTLWFLFEAWSLYHIYWTCIFHHQQDVDVLDSVFFSWEAQFPPPLHLVDYLFPKALFSER